MITGSSEMPHMYQHLYTSRINEVQWSCHIHHKNFKLANWPRSISCGLSDVYFLSKSSHMHTNLNGTWLGFSWSSVTHTDMSTIAHIRMHTHSLAPRKYTNKTYWMWLLKFVKNMSICTFSAACACGMRFVQILHICSVILLFFAKENAKIILYIFYTIF